MNATKLLLLMRHRPYQGLRATEALEAALVSAVFDQPTSVLFRDDGVWQLLPNQAATPLGTRTHHKLLSALPDYDVQALFVCTESLAQRGLALADIEIAVTPVTPQQQQQLLAEQHVVLND